jgi:hypothetical protein
VRTIYCLVASRRPLTSEARAQSHTSPCEICGGRSGTEIGFSPSNSVSPATLIPALLHNNLQTAEARIRFKKQRSFVRLDRKLLSVLVGFDGSTDVCFQLGLDRVQLERGQQVAAHHHWRYVMYTFSAGLLGLCGIAHTVPEVGSVSTFRWKGTIDVRTPLGPR